MHGILLKGLKEFVVETYDRSTWDEIRDEAPVERKVYLPIETYDDGELTALVEAAATVTGESTDHLLDAYGRSVAGRLLSTYDNVLDDDWTMVDLLLNANERVYGTLRQQNPKMNPPQLDCRQVDANKVLVGYQSPRKLCSVAKGVIRGVGERYGQPVDVTEGQCMHDGADYCEFVVTF
ncbi:heme NO-binding domain-containing protein [Halobacteriaceae archaeon GCM10025711]